MHASYNLSGECFCNVLDRVLGISDHNPIIFGFRRNLVSHCRRISKWIIDHPDFLEEARGEFEFRKRIRD